MIYVTDNFPGRELKLDGKKHLYFGGTSYLGLQTNTVFRETLIRNLKKYGTNNGASRNSNIRFSVYGQAEAHLAQMVGSESCVTLSSGYLAGQFVVQYFNTARYKLFYAPNTHSALHLATNKKQAVTFASLNIAVREHLAGKSKSIPVVLLDSIDFSGAHYPHFEGLKTLPLKETILIADDSHGLGVVGSKGGGVFRILEALGAKELIVCSSLGKGFGIQGGAIFASKSRTAELVKTPFFGGASPTAPANLATLLECEGLFIQKRKRLQQHIDYFLKSLKSPRNFSYMQNHPAFSYSNALLTEYLREHKIIVTDFNYPNKQSGLKNRIVLSAQHRKSDIEVLAHCIGLFPF
ncbi:MAG: aminotransferase class I/II-fold pyridoxal phosphate-dependent enzyme [Bacteroidota bacterium]